MVGLLYLGLPTLCFCPISILSKSQSWLVVVWLLPIRRCISSFMDLRFSGKDIYIYIYIHIYIQYILFHIMIHTYIHTYVHTYRQTYILTYILTYLHTYILTYLHTYIHTYIYIYVCVSDLCVFKQIRALYKYTYICIYLCYWRYISMVLFHCHCVCLICLFLKQAMQYISIYVYNKSKKTCCY